MNKLARQMKQRLNKNSTLAELVEVGHLSTKQKWTKIDEVDFEFPEMDLEDLQLLFFGSYQIKQYQSYAEEHLDVNSDFVIQISKETDDIIRCAIKSRHSTSTRYYAWIQFSLIGGPILSWYCQCKAGARTIGACAHKATIIWYLSYARHHDFEYSTNRGRIQQSIEKIILSESESENNNNTN